MFSGLHVSSQSMISKLYFFFFEIEFHYVSQAAPKLRFLLPHPPSYLDHRQYHHIQIYVRNLILNATGLGGAV